MNKRIKNKKLTKQKVNKFSDGAWKNNWKGDKLGGTVASTVGGIANVTTNALQLAQPNDNGYNAGIAANKSKIDAIKNQKVTASTMSELNNSLSSINWGDVNDLKQSLSFEEAGGASGGEWASGILSGATSGAAAGSLIAPPWGTIGGAIIGAGAAIGGLGFKNAQAKKLQENFILNTELQKAEMERSNESLKDSILRKHQEISQNNLNDFMLYNIKSYGGPLFNHTGNWSNGLTFIDEGGTHEQNPFEGVMVGVDQEGTPNLVEEGEVIFGDYVFSNRLKPTKKILEDGGFSDKYIDWTFAKIAEDLQKESAERPIDFISNNTLNNMMGRLITFQEMVREKKKSNSYKNGGLVNKFDGLNNTQWLNDIINEPYDFDITNAIDPVLLAKIDHRTKTTPYLTRTGEKISPDKAIVFSSDGTKFKDKTSKFNVDQLSNLGRYTPAIINAGSTLYNASQKPDKLDYTHFDDAFKYAENIPTVSYTPVGGKVTPDLVDPNYLLNQHIAERASLRNSIKETAPTGSIAMMHLANNAYAGQRNDAEALLAFNRENWNRKLQAAQHNLGIDTTNMQAGIQTQGMNQTRGQQIANAAFQNANARLGIDQTNLGFESQKGQAVSQSIGAMANDIAGIATENYWTNEIEKNPAFMEYIAMMNKAKSSKKCGGMLTRKRRK